jgi:hypothetical protein
VPAPTVQPADWHVKNGLAAAVYPYVEVEQQQKVLNADLNEADVIALQVIVENRTARMMLVRPLDLVLTLPDQRTLGPTSVASVANMVEETGSVAGPAIAFGIIGYMVASNAEEKAKQARVADYEPVHPRFRFLRSAAWLRGVRRGHLIGVLCRRTGGHDRDDPGTLDAAGI